MKKNLKMVICLMLVTFLLFSTTGSFALKITKESKETENNFLTENIIESSEDVDDYDELLDTEITFKINEIRAFDEIDFFGEPDFYVKVFINDVEYTSPVWKNMNYVKNPDCQWTVDVPDDEEYVDITIQLWDKNFGKDRICDISGNHALSSEGKEINLMYSIKTGHWFGDDKVNHYPSWDDRGDNSGYGRLSGCDDGSIYQKDLDCEIWFEITQNDYDGDGIPYWMEVNIFETDPEVDNRGEDTDEDGVPIEWEFKWGHVVSYNHRDDEWYEGFIYDPFTWEDHSSFDLDEDGIDNVEEYKAEKEGFRTEPYRQDILLEIDQMEQGPNGEGQAIAVLTKDLLYDAFARHNIVFEIDDQGRQIPFDINTSYYELQEIYFKYFMNENKSHWRRGAFHYAPIIYKSDYHPGFMWSSMLVDGDDSFNFTDENSYNISIYGDCFQVATKHHDKKASYNYFGNIFIHKTFNISKQRAIVYATAMMHETGHVLGIYHSDVEGCDNTEAVKPWQPDFWVFIRYHSCMNYAWMYQFVDYSDGSNGKNDNNDWETIDLTAFQIERNGDYNG